MEVVSREGICPWLVRDHHEWRAGLLLTASADLLLNWHTARLTMSDPARAAAERRYGDLIAEIRYARLADDVDAVETACRSLITRATNPPRPPHPLHAIFAHLTAALANTADPQPCFLSCIECRDQ